jgi:hypothetical protein
VRFEFCTALKTDCGRTSDITFYENTALNFLISLIGVLCKEVLHRIRRWEATRNWPVTNQTTRSPHLECMRITVQSILVMIIN